VFEAKPPRWRKLSGSRSHLDSPQAGDPVYGSCVTISGWVYAQNRDPASCRICAWIDDDFIGETNLLLVRADVCAALSLPEGIATSFRLLGRARANGNDPRAAEITITASWDDREERYEIGRCPVQLFPARLEQRPYGDVVHPEQERLLHRENIYGSGPPVDEPSPETLQIIEQCLRTRSSLLDVGCGAGAYGPPLRANGHTWLGLEVNPVCWELLENRNLSFRKVAETARALPVQEAEFDSAICIEVLEHIRDVGVFLSEIARAIRERALFSVPNMEVLPYFSPWHVVPWHLLEGDHKNFFTRASLHALLRKYFARVEVFSYGAHPLRTPDGVPLHAHLFAIAEKETGAREQSPARHHFQ